MGSKAPKFEPLERLDLRKRQTVGQIVDGMSRCSFGARMLGEVAQTLTDWAKDPKRRPAVIYTGKPSTPLGQLLREMVRRRWFSRLLTPEAYPKAKRVSGNVVVVGFFTETQAQVLYRKPERAIFINSAGLAKPGQVMDGWFPDAVFADPAFVMPVLFLTLEERLEGRRASVKELIKMLKGYGGLADEVVHGAETFVTMVENPECTVFLTLSGAMTIAKMGLVICEMIDREMVHAIASTGALMAHGLIESVGLAHYRYNPKISDRILARKKLNRVTDALEPETNFDHIEEILDRVLWDISEKTLLSPRTFHRMIGAYLAKHYPNERGILKSAFEKDVPVFVPAFHDSEIGNDLFVHNQKRRRRKLARLVMDIELDSEYLVKRVARAKRIGIFSIGGGVPRNNIQNVAPMIEIMNQRLGTHFPEHKFFYGCRICPDPMWYGHLSGCTYSEGASWRKMDLGGRFSAIHADATQVWPFLVRLVMDKQDHNLHSSS